MGLEHVGGELVDAVDGVRVARAGGGDVTLALTAIADRALRDWGVDPDVLPDTALAPLAGHLALAVRLAEAVAELAGVDAEEVIRDLAEMTFRPRVPPVPPVG